MSGPESTVRRWFAEVWNARKESAVDDLLAADGVVYGVGPQPLRGPAEFKPFHRAFLDAFPDLQIDVVSTVTEGDRVALHFRATGTHSSAALGGKATGQPVSFDGMCIVRARGDQLIEGHNCIDFLTMYQQMGWVPAALPA